VRRGLIAAGLTAVLVAVPGIAAAQAGGVSGLLVRVQGDVTVNAGESADLVLVVSGDAEVRGRAAAVVVVGGTARLTGARVGELVVVRGTAELRRGTVVEGDVWLTWARLDQAPGARVEGGVHRGVARFGWGWLAVSPLLSVGLALLVAGVGLLSVLLAPRLMQRAGRALTGEPARTLAWALVLFVVVPSAAVLAFFTVVGLPAALVVLALLLPLAGLVGLAVAGLRLGVGLLRSRSPRPYGAAALGSITLLGVGLVPVAGQVVVLLAAALGAGALAQTFRRPQPGTTEEAPAEGVVDAAGSPGGS